MKSRLHLKPIGPAETRSACVAWHYSRTVSASTVLNLGVWEDDRFIGVVVFGSGNRQIGRPYDLNSREVCELSRVALDRHVTPVTRIVAIALGLLRKARPSIRLIVSYADPKQGHVGSIYQAGNWTYVGATKKAEQGFVCPDGVVRHQRTVYDLYDRETRLAFPRVQQLHKHKYLYPFDGPMTVLVAGLEKDAPRRVASIAGDAPALQAGQGGSTPTATLPRPRRKAAPSP